MSTSRGSRTPTRAGASGTGTPSAVGGGSSSDRRERHARTGSGATRRRGAATGGGGGGGGIGGGRMGVGGTAAASPSVTTGEGRERRGNAKRGGDEGVVALSREIKALTPSLQRLLEVNSPWSKSVEAARLALRRAHYALIINHPNSPYSQSIDHLWISTSHVVITAFRGSISELDKRTGAHVETRKVVWRFKTFLTGEIAWYKDAAREFVDVFGLDRVDGGSVEGWLEAAGIPSTPLSSVEARGRRLRLSPEEAKKKLSLVHKTFLCLGDLERYKEQYGSERDRKRGVAASAASKTKEDEGRYAVAKRYYEVARGLMPENGNPWNQLALVATSTADTFTSIYCYLRALAVRQAFMTAEHNLVKTFKHVLADWKAARGDEGEGELEFEKLTSGEEARGVKEEMMVLQAKLYLGVETSNLANLVATHREHIRKTVAARLVPTETIAKAIVMCIAAHWQTRLGNPGAPFGGAKEHERMYLEYTLVMTGTLLEVACEEFKEVLAASKAAASTAGRTVMDESAVADDEEQVEQEMHTKISAVVRRLLPPLRIFSKWLKSNQDVLQSPTLIDTPSKLAMGNVSIQDGVSRFWDIYLDFLARMESLFPLEKLPALTEPLEEDFDMRGFAPLKRGMLDCLRQEKDVERDDQADRIKSNGRGSVHPNEEQLMRISDLLVDGKLIVQGDRTGMFRDRGVFASRVLGGPVEIQAKDGSFSMSGRRTPLAAHVNLHLEQPQPIPGGMLDDVEADLASVSTETEDDPVNLAMRATMGDGSSLADDDDRDDAFDEFADEEEEIMWVGGMAAAAAATPQMRMPSQVPTDGRLPARPTVSTAEDLLQSLMIGTAAHPSSRQHDSGAFSAAPGRRQDPHVNGSAPNLLFGSPAATSGGIPSIWSSGGGDTASQPMRTDRSGSGSAFGRAPMVGMDGFATGTVSGYPTGPIVGSNAGHVGAPNPWQVSAYGTPISGNPGVAMSSASPWSIVGGPSAAPRDSTYQPFGEGGGFTNAPGQGRPVGHQFSPFGS